MMLLGLLAVGILAIATSQNRIAGRLALVTEARHQALVGLDAAIAELQVQLGPDQRVTASSGLVTGEGDPAQHILGVWNSWQSPIYGNHGGKSIASTYTEGRGSMFRTWLISSRNPESLRQIGSISNLGSRSSGTRVCLLGEGTLGNAGNKNYVYADLVDMPASGNNVASFAWWVCGENQKANVAVEEREPTTDPVEVLHRTWDTPPPNFYGSSKVHQLADGSGLEHRDKMLSIRSLPLGAHAGTTSGMPYYFDLTLYSYSLLTNVRDGGLKMDLNLLLNKERLSDTPFKARTDQDCPIAEGNDLPEPLESNMPIGSWQVMHAYHNTWPDGTVSNENGFAARLGGTALNAYSLISGNLLRTTTKGGDSVTFYEDRAIEGNREAGYARSPLMVAFMGAWGLMLTDPQNGFGGYSHMIAYAPFSMWWNPYNVRMRVGAKKLWLMSLPYRTTSVLVRTNGSLARWPMVQYLRKATDGNGSIGLRNTFGDDWGNYLVNSASDQSSDIIFEPGEILVFSMAEGVNSIKEHNKNGAVEEGDPPYLGPQQVPFMLGDNGGELHNYAFSLYSFGMQFLPNSLMLESHSSYSNASVTTRIDEVDGSYVKGSQLFDTVGDVFGPHERGVFAVPHGFDGIDSSSEKGKSVALSRLSSKPDRFPGAGGIAPNIFSLGWYDYEKCSEDELTFVKDETWNTNMTNDIPTYFMAVGVVPKSYNDSFNEGMPLFRGKDYRTKLWLHSNPVMGSSALNNPDDQQRQYNPYQLATVELGVGLSRGVLDTPNNRNGVWGLSSAGSGGGESVSFIATHELPLHPPLSLAGFAGMRLKPGWYSSDTGDGFSLASMRRMQYQAGVPGVGIGNSFADPCLPPNDVHAINQNEIDTSLSTNGRLFTDFFDYAVIINDALWDQWFCSSMTDMPTRSGRRKVDDLVNAFTQGTEKLPVSRYKLVSQAGSPSEIAARIVAKDGWREVARYLMVEGGFNVNSVSEEAWAATLLGLSKRDLVNNSSHELHIVQNKPNTVLFSRFMVSNCVRSLDEVGFNVLEGANTLRPNMSMTTAWGDLRALSPDTIRALAKEMVKKVRERGPFLSMSDFINRRLTGGEDTALTGALQAAIDATDINDVFNDSGYKVQVARSGNLYRFPKAEEGSMFTAAPGYLIQSDVLASLGNILTVRDDTFTVRAYGCVRNSGRAVLSQAWCEAVVQRTVDYVDPTNAPTDAPENPHSTSADDRHTAKLSEINRVMGRRFRIVSFRWLDIWDI